MRWGFFISVMGVVLLSDLLLHNGGCIVVRLIPARDLGFMQVVFHGECVKINRFIIQGKKDAYFFYIIF